MTVMRRSAAVATILAAVLAAPACSDDKSDSTASSTSMATTAAAAADLVGAGCKSYAEQVPTGAGSVSGMAQDPVATAASNNPMLTTLVAAVSGQLNPQVNLVDTLNGGQFTVFAPTDAAFQKVDPAVLESLKTDSAALTGVLTYHVVPGQIAPDRIAGEHATVQGAKVDVTRTGDDIKVNTTASVICGGVKTANATVYMIDTVLMPPAA
ncbi:fasciclin domain-containing protein [Nocardia sp. 2]|uniref:Fasciclin domain-containing protein n=1 Tax=Nocardia acididurans TaxID=2802282 RepID=A0ABS1M1S7_9NOCA|nr:fasciclin domain-containing protein [Nocardia acididurans]MBL1074617.1 fasciclin domain-containing protein [Nocardia acididurans]